MDVMIEWKANPNNSLYWSQTLELASTYLQYKRYRVWIPYLPHCGKLWLDKAAIDYDDQARYDDRVHLQANWVFV